MFLLFLWISLFLAALVLLTSYICFRVVFYASRKEPKVREEYPVPEGKIYEPFREDMVRWIKETRQLPSQEFTITSFDGLKLRGKYYEYAPGATMELMFHGYRGNAERDLSGGVQRCFALGRNALIVDQRTSAGSEGNVISFGINEHRDCLSWVDFCVEHFGPDVKIILTGISMGASTVLIAAGQPLPDNVVGVLADCGYTSAKEIILCCARRMGLPARLLYPFVRLGARLFGRFDPDSFSAVEAVTRCRLPVIFFHGEGDDFVPCSMSQENFEACASPKRLVTVPGAGHGLAYPVDRAGYLTAVAEFFTENGVPTSVIQ